MLEHIHKIIQEKTHIFLLNLSSWFEPKKCKRNACVLTVYPPGHPWNVGGMILVLKCARAYNRGEEEEKFEISSISRNLSFDGDFKTNNDGLSTASGSWIMLQTWAINSISGL